MEQFIGFSAPWHWHKAVELFFVEEGCIEYNTTYGKYIFPKGSGGMVNSNILHMTKQKNNQTVQLLHIFDASFIGGTADSKIEKKYITPLTTLCQLDIIQLYPDNIEQKKVLDLIKNSFNISDNEFGYEIKLREKLSEIWMLLLEKVYSKIEKKQMNTKADERIKLMMIYVHENFSDKITISNIAKAGYVSERDCFRIFHKCLNMTPLEYVTNYRLRKSCDMLVNSNDTVSTIGQECGLGSSSYFGNVFKKYIGVTPTEYRKKWQNSNI